MFGKTKEGWRNKVGIGKWETEIKVLQGPWTTQDIQKVLKTSAMIA